MTDHDGLDHGQWTELAAGFALHALEPADELAFRAHLAGCPTCQDSVAEFERAAAELAGALPEVAPPASLWAAIDQQVAGSHEAAPTSAVRRLAGRRMTPRRRLVLAAAAAVVAAAIALPLGLTGSGPSTATPVLATAAVRSCLAEAGCHAVLLHQPSQPDRDLAAALVRGDRLSVVSTALASTSGNTIYVLWWMRGATATALGKFTVTRSGVSQVYLGRHARSGSGRLAITRQLGPALPSHPSYPEVAVST